MPNVIERGHPEEPERNRGSLALSGMAVAKLATYMNGGTFKILDPHLEVHPTRETVKDDLKIEFAVTRHTGQRYSVEIYVEDVVTNVRYDLAELEVDLIDRTDPIEPWTYGRKLTTTEITFNNLLPHHTYELIFRGEQGGVAAKLPPPLGKREAGNIPDSGSPRPGYD